MAGIRPSLSIRRIISAALWHSLAMTAYDRQWWDDFQAKLFECKNRRNDCCHTKLFRWENLETLLKTIFAASESEHHNRIEGLIYESKVGLLMKEGER